MDRTEDHHRDTPISCFAQKGFYVTLHSKTIVQL